MNQKTLTTQLAVFISIGLACAGTSQSTVAFLTQEI